MHRELRGAQGHVHGRPALTLDHPLLADGFAAIRRQFQVPESFPPAVLAAADEAARRPFGGDRVDRRSLELVTLDPAGSTDLDQAMAIESNGDDLVLSYAIADVGFFVERGGVIAALDGTSRLADVGAAVVRSRRQLAYETVTVADLPALLPELARRVEAADEARGAIHVEVPEPEVVIDAAAPGGVAVMAAAYAHATAPLRRLADRYVLDALLDRPGPPVDWAALAEVMETAETRAAHVERAALDLVEAITLSARVGEVFSATVLDTDHEGARIQLVDPPVRARLKGSAHQPGDVVSVRLTEADPIARRVTFTPA